MTYSVILEIKEGSFELGFRIKAQIRRDGKTISTPQGQLQAQPQILELYERIFPGDYQSWGQRTIWGRTIEDGDGVESIRKSCVNGSIDLERLFQVWLRQADLGNITTQIAQTIPKGTQPSFILETADNSILQRLPWHRWEWLSDYFPDTEIVLSRTAFAVKPSPQRFRILVIFGSEEGIDLQADWASLQKNIEPLATLTRLSQPSLNDVRKELRKGYHALFFAGHSSTNSEGSGGSIQINNGQPITINDIRDELRSAIRKGLQLAFLNSCDGLGLAAQLSDLNIPYIIVMREQIHNDVAAKFVEHCLENLARGETLNRSVFRARRELRYLEDRYICASWMPIIFQSREAPEYRPFPQNILQRIRRKLFNIFESFSDIPRFFRIHKWVYLLIGLCCVLAIGYFGWRPSSDVVNSPSIIHGSIGGSVLFTHNLSSASLQAKQDIARSFTRRNYQDAIDKSEELRVLYPEDPEPLLVINNAKVLQQEPDPKKLITIPIVSSATNGYSTAVEVLRGAEIAQMEIDRIKGKKMLFEVYIDNNDRKLAEEVAQKIIADKHFAVVGHIDSNTSTVAAPIYQKANVVMISPTSSTMDLKGMGNFIFRTVPNSEMMATKLAEYVSKSANKKKLGFCYDSNLNAGSTFEKAFRNEIKKQGGEILSVSCDASKPEFLPQSIVEQMVKKGADGLVLYFHLNEDYQFKAARNLARAAKQKLPLFGSHSLVATDILKSGQDFEEMVVVTPRHADLPLAKNFRKKFNATFKIEPVWRDMMAYDAVKAIAFALEGSDGTSNGLMNELHAPDFVVPNGSSGPIKFSRSGDRLVTPSIAQVKCENVHCKFSLIPEIVPTLNRNLVPQ